MVRSGYKTVFGQNIKNVKDIVRKSSNLELADGHSGRLVSFSLPSPFPSLPPCRGAAGAGGGPSARCPAELLFTHYNTRHVSPVWNLVSSRLMYLSVTLSSLTIEGKHEKTTQQIDTTEVNFSITLLFG